MTNTNVKDVGGRGCDCRDMFSTCLAVTKERGLLAMTKERGLPAMAEEEKWKEYESKHTITGLS